MTVSWIKSKESLGKELKFIYQHISVCMFICVYICWVTLIVNPRRQNVRDTILRLRKLRLMSATLLKYICCKDEKIHTVAEVGTTWSEDVQCPEAIWEGQTEEVTSYTPFKFEVGRTCYKGISVRKKMCKFMQYERVWHVWGMVRNSLWLEQRVNVWGGRA